MRREENRQHHRWRLFNLLALSLLLAARRASAVLLVYNQTTHGQLPTRFDDVPAVDGFGPRIPEEGFAGRLQVAKPNMYACSALDPPVRALSTSPDSSEGGGEGRGGTGKHGAIRKGWGRRGSKSRTIPIAAAQRETLASPVATTGSDGGGAEGGEASGEARGEEELPSAVLISRSVRDGSDGCTFETKVLNAQAAGFGMVVVHDYQPGNLFKMSRSTDKGSQHPAVEIPLVLVSHASGLALKALIEGTSDPRGPEVYLDNTDPFDMLVTVNLTMLMMVTGFLMALLTCGSMMVVTLHRYLRRYESLVAGTNRPMSLPEVLQLSEVRVEAGSRLDGESCPVCLETYRVGDKLRSLPCGHAFHAGCITPWLTQRQRTCPMCKDPITIRPSPSAASASAASASAASASAASAPEEGADGGGAGRVDGVAGDRLPLLSNSRGVHSGGGSIQEPSPV